MQLIAFATREGESVDRLVSNRDTDLVSVGVLHCASNKVLSISISPEGAIHVSFGPPNSHPTLARLGTLSNDGLLDLHEPWTLKERHEL